MNIFIAGMEKCGTTTLADWLVKNNFADYLVPNIKEPYIYASEGQNLNSYIRIGPPLLDASVWYSLNSSAIAKMPESNTKIIICFRNQFERTWSSYKFKKIAVKHQEAAGLLLDGFPTQSESSKYYQADDLLGYLKFITKAHYPTKLNQYIEKYFQSEVENLLMQSFEERIKYEISFFSKIGHGPFLSILESSFYTFPLKNILTKFTNEDITLVSVNKLSASESLRASLVSRIFGSSKPTPQIEQEFSSKKFSIDEDMPNFKDARWNFLRSFFQDDLIALNNLVLENTLTEEFIDRDELTKYLI